MSNGPLLVTAALSIPPNSSIFGNAFRERDTLVFLPWRSGSAYEAVTPTLSWLSGLGFQSSPLALPQVSSCSLSQVRLGFLNAPGGRPSGRSQHSRMPLFTSFPPQIKPRRRVKLRARSFTGSGADYIFDEIGVLLVEPKTYGPLLLETLSRLGIPCTFFGEQPLLTTRRGKPCRRYATSC